MPIVLNPRWAILGALFWMGWLTAADTGADELAGRRTAIVRAVEQVRPSVVNIHGRKLVTDTVDSSTPAGQARQVNGMGTGIVIDERGYIVTNYHVVDGVRRIQVTTAHGDAVVARLVAHDPQTDLAIIKIDSTTPLPVIRIGTSSDLMVGEAVIAVGNAYGYEHTVTRGIISALHRTVQVSDDQQYADLIQTDASINPGNSGGPLLNIDGDLIGINVAVRVGAQGIGFAVPIDLAMETVSQLLDQEVAQTVLHGVNGRTVSTSQGSTFVVNSVAPGTPGEEAGLAAGDVIERIGEFPVARSLDFERALLHQRSGEAVGLTYRRGANVHHAQLLLRQPRGGSSATDLVERVWEALGLRLSPVPPAAMAEFGAKYRGGLKIVAVRGDSPAARQGIRYGDILVGMHKWETVSMDNVAYILDSDVVAQPNAPVKFYILRDGVTLYGHVQVSLASR